MLVRGVFFDAADVLYRRPEPTDAFVARLLQDRGIAAGLSPEARRVARALRSEAKSGRLGADEYWCRVLELYGVADAEQRRALAGQIDEYSDRVLPMPGAREALAGLKQRGLVLGIVTDTVYPLERKRRWLAAVGVAEFIDVIACSTVVGLHKPDPGMYLFAVQQAGLAAGESAFVGHSTSELEGARRAGLPTIAVNYAPDAQADYYVPSLVDLLQVPILTSRM